jgi:hypothetical protein
MGVFASDSTSPCAEKLIKSSKIKIAKKFLLLPATPLTLLSGHLVVKEGIQSTQNIGTAFFVKNLGKLIKASYLFQDDKRADRKAGKMLKRFKKKYLAEQNNLEIEEIASAFVKADQHGLFCAQRENGKLELNYQHFISFLRGRKGKSKMQKIAWLFFSEDGETEVDSVIEAVKRARFN